MDGIIGLALAGAAFGVCTFVLFRLGAGVAGDARQPGAWPAAYGAVLDRVFGTDAFSLRFIAGVLALSLLSFALFFATYLLKLPTFADSLSIDVFQRRAVMRQLLTMFVPVTVIISYLSLAYCRDVVLRMERGGGPGRMAFLLAQDLLMKVVIVVLAMGLVYLLLGPSGSFTSPQDALLAVPGVLYGAVRFQNLNCVYIYSSLLSSVWLWAWLLSGVSGGVAARYPGVSAALISAVLYWAVVLLT